MRIYAGKRAPSDWLLRPKGLAQVSLKKKIQISAIPNLIAIATSIAKIEVGLHQGTSVAVKFAVPLQPIDGIDQ